MKLGTTYKIYRFLKKIPGWIGYFMVEWLPMILIIGALICSPFLNKIF